MLRINRSTPPGAQEVDDGFKYLLTLASLFGVLYAPFHFLDLYASPQAKARARIAIKEGIANSDIAPLTSVVNSVFGKKHLTVRCFLFSALMTLVFTALTLGLTARFFDIGGYVEEYTSRATKANEILSSAMKDMAALWDELEQQVGKPQDGRDVELLATIKENQELVREVLRTSIPTGQPVLLWMLMSVALSMNVLCDYIALWKTRRFLDRIEKSESRWAISAYLLADAVLAVLLWLVGIWAFLLVNREPFLEWSQYTPNLVVTVGLVSLATTLAVSIWLYTYLLGAGISKTVRYLLARALSGVISLVDPKDHAFKIIGLVGSCAMLVAIVATLTIIR